MQPLQPTDPRRVGRYRITARLGAGGMGRVYLGHSPSGRLVAVKVVRPELAEDTGFRRRFAREVEAARKVNGFFTAALIDADPDCSSPWLATAYVPGMPLDDAVAAHGPWPVASVRALGAGLAEALEAIHAAGLVHRDLKPSNVLIAPDGPRVVDFGISVAAEATALTRTGMIVGTPGFMAPEQLVGKPVTPATDVFALGAVLAYAATGTGPFGTGSAQSLNFRIVYEEPDLAALPSPGLEIIARCLAKDPAQRPAVTALVEELALTPPADGYTPNGIVPGTAAWLPGPVAQALPATAATPTPAAPHQPASPAPTPPPLTSPPSTPPQPAPQQPASVPSTPPPPPPAPGVADPRFPFTASPAAHAAPAAAAQPRAPHTALPLWLTLPTMALVAVLPFWYGTRVADDLADTWPFAVTAALAFASSATVLVLLRRSPATPVPRWARIPHTLIAGLATGLLTFPVVDNDLTALDTGAWTFATGCGALLYSAFRFPGPSAPATTAQPPARRTALPLWLTLPAMALVAVLPFWYGTRVADDLANAWPFAVAAALAFASSATVLVLLRRSRATPVPRWARIPHTLIAGLATGLLTFPVVENELAALDTGAWTFATGCGALLYSAFRFPGPQQAPPS